MSQNWSHTKLVAIWKGASKGNANDPTAYRGLQIADHLNNQSAEKLVREAAM